jgi:hypothetical protein
MDEMKQIAEVAKLAGQAIDDLNAALAQFAETLNNARDDSE